MKISAAICVCAILGLSACSTMGGSVTSSSPVAFCQPGVCEGSTGSAGSLPDQLGELVR